ncbi:MAG: ATP-binding protein [Nanoarchaeota archaeon]|nr:ATP-binding protein [Nanoarchaeota archaeon]
MKDLIKSIIKDFHKRGLPQFIERNIEIPFESGKVISLIGPRRAGKTYMMYQIMSGVKDITNIVYINFEDERLEISANDLNLIIEAFFELYPGKKEKDIFFFFDEIQEVKGWEKFIRRIYDSINKNIFVTGSSAKLLSKEIATSLRGRTISYEVFPLSFKEFLMFKKVEPDIHSTKGKAAVFSSFMEFMKRGGFPEIIGMNKEIAEKTLNTYFEVMLYRDIAERYEVQNITPLKIFLKRLLANSSKEFTIHKIFNNLKSEGIKVSKDSIYKYLEYCSDAYLLFSLSNFSESGHNQITKKAYSVDVGLSQMLSFSLSKDLGRILENIVLLELKREGKEIFYHKMNFECDFIIKEREKVIRAVQVCYSLNEENRERELKGLMEAMKRFNLKSGLIITMEQDEQIGNIRVVPAVKWLLS